MAVSWKATLVSGAAPEMGKDVEWHPVFFRSRWQKPLSSTTFYQSFVSVAFFPFLCSQTGETQW